MCVMRSIARTHAYSNLVLAAQDFLSCGSELAAKAQGKLRSEGKEYVVRDGDVILFRFNV